MERPKSDNKVYLAIGRGCGKSLYHAKLIKAMIEAGCDFVPVNTESGDIVYEVRAKEEV